jgi:hypothetical protein
MKTNNIKVLKQELANSNSEFKYIAEKLSDTRSELKATDDFVHQLMHERELLVNAADRLITFLPENNQARREYIRLKELLKYKN